MCVSLLSQKLSSPAEQGISSAKALPSYSHKPALEAPVLDVEGSLPQGACLCSFASQNAVHGPVISESLGSFLEKKDHRTSPQPHWVRICSLTRSRGDSNAHSNLRSTALFYLRPGWMSWQWPKQRSGLEATGSEPRGLNVFSKCRFAKNLVCDLYTFCNLSGTLHLHLPGLRTDKGRDQCDVWVLP